MTTSDGLISPPWTMVTSGSGGAHRLRNAREFDAVFRQAKYRVSSPEFLVLAIENDQLANRIGMVVNKKVAGNSVNRNRIRRLIRESFRLGFDNTGLDLVVVARPASGSCENSSILESLDRLWRQLSEKMVDRQS